MDRFHKIWTTAMAAGLSATGLILILELADPPVLGMIAYVVIYIVMIAVAFIFHIIAHEGGHLLGGLLSGYDFASFRVFNMMIVKRDGKYLRKKFKMVGTGGQCLMAPPQPFRPDYPYRLYNVSGGLANFIIAGFCIAISVWIFAAASVSSGGSTLSDSPNLCWLLLIINPLIVAGIYCGVTNLVPMIIGGVANDGWNLIHLGKDPSTRRILWLLLDMMAIINRGGQFRDMPGEWFQMDAKPDYNNTFQAALGVYRFNYLVDTGRLDEAVDLATEILRNGSGTLQLYRYELLCESIFLELIGEGRRVRVERLYTPELQRYIKATESYPHRQRLHYAMAMLYHRDEGKAAVALEGFKKACETYPNDGEISSEWESIGLVDCKLAEVNALAQQAVEEAATAAEAEAEHAATAAEAEAEHAATAAEHAEIEAATQAQKASIYRNRRLERRTFQKIKIRPHR